MLVLSCGTAATLPQPPRSFRAKDRIGKDVTIGHAAIIHACAIGDECLIAVAELINQYFCRATDISIRMCDDEFVVLCLDDEDCRVLERAQHFRRQLQSLALRDTKCRQHQVRVRVGIYSTTPDKYTTVEELVEKASQLVSQPLGDHNDHVAHSKGNDARTIKP